MFPAFVFFSFSLFLSETVLKYYGGSNSVQSLSPVVMDIEIYLAVPSTFGVLGWMD